MAMKMNAAVIDRLFTRFGMLYGAAWDRSIGSTPMADVKSIWGEYLEGFDVDDVAYAIDRLTDKVPNVIAFRELCRAAPRKDLPRLEAPARNPLVVASEIEKQIGLKEAIVRKRSDGLAWAKTIMGRVESGDSSVSRYARESAEMALGKRTRMSA